MDQRAAPNINILSFKDQQASSVGRFLDWSLRYGRVIIILTEFIVIAAFISRFYFDRKLSDLHDQIKAMSNYVQSSQPVEKEFLNFQATLNEAGTVLGMRKNYANLITNVSSIKPTDSTLKEIAVKANVLTVVIIVPTPTSLNLFLQGLAQKGHFTDISIEDVSIKESELLMQGTAKINKSAFD